MMTRLDHKILFTALSFMTIVMKGKGDARVDAEKVMRLASLVEAFCQEKAATARDLSGDDASVDVMIDRYVRELKDREQTRLPDDVETLIKLHERLQHRKQRRTHLLLYAHATAEKLADLVLGLLDEEINVLKHKAVN